MSDSEHDDEFEEYLKRRVPIDKGASQREPLEPPPELDRIVIGKARKAIQGAAPLHLYRAPKWALPVGLAATILLSFAILLDLGVRAKRNDTSLQATASQTSGIQTPQSAPGSSEPRPTPKTAPAPAAAAAPAIQNASRAANVSDAEQELSSDTDRSRLAKAEKAAKRARPEQEMAARAMQEVAVVGSRSANSLVTPSPIAAVPADEMNPAAPTAPPDVTKPAPLPQRDAVSVDATSQAAPPPQVARRSSSEAETKVDNPDPATWLERIEKLRSTGQTAEAEREMKRFRATYPDYPLPKTTSP
jgi:hypothetical protein